MEGGRRICRHCKRNSETGTIETIKEPPPRSGARASYRLGIRCRPGRGGALGTSRRLKRDRLLGVIAVGRMIGGGRGEAGASA